MTQHDVVNGGRRGRFVLALTAAVTGVFGVVVLMVAFSSQEPAPPRLDSSIGELDSPAASPSVSPPARLEAPPEVRPAQEVPLGPSRPVSISIPAIDVNSEVFPIGKAQDGTLAVPQPGPNLDKAAWFENSPSPGQPGPSVIEGHVATAESGPSIFFELAELRPGDRIDVERQDGKTVVFEVDALREFSKNEFPTQLVYGGELDEPQLRLITCSNFDPSIGEHTGNLIVFSHMVNVKPA